MEVYLARACFIIVLAVGSWTIGKWTADLAMAHHEKLDKFTTNVSYILLALLTGIVAVAILSAPFYLVADHMVEMQHHIMKGAYDEISKAN